jgi:hypothetical protein
MEKNEQIKIMGLSGNRMRIDVSSSGKVYTKVFDGHHLDGDVAPPVFWGSETYTGSDILMWMRRTLSTLE